MILLLMPVFLKLTPLSTASTKLATSMDYQHVSFVLKDTTSTLGALVPSTLPLWPTLDAVSTTVCTVTRLTLAVSALFLGEFRLLENVKPTSPISVKTLTVVSVPTVLSV